MAIYLSLKLKFMAHTYTRLHIQLVFAVRYRDCLIDEPNRKAIERYMMGIVEGLQCTALAIYCNPDHCHLLVGLHPAISVSELAQKVKAMSSKWINARNSLAQKFYWQVGYGAFSYGYKQIPHIVEYINNQPMHHQKTTFHDEYIAFLRANAIDYDVRYVFTEID